MSYETISISVDAELKMKAGKILNALGLDLETAITMFLRSVERCGGMPFDTEEAEKEKKCLQVDNSKKYIPFEQFMKNRVFCSSEELDNVLKKKETEDLFDDF